MRFKFFRVSVHSLDTAADELNRFLNSHRVDSVERQFVNQGGNSYWLFCVEYPQQQETKATATSAGTRRKERVDYREILNDDDFQTILTPAGSSCHFRQAVLRRSLVGGARP